MPKLLKVVTAPNPILYQKTKEVKEFDDDLKAFVADMVPTMRKEDGVGLAAPQVGSSKRVAVIEFAPQSEEEAEHSPIPLTIIINPKIISHSKQTNTTEEGCLSLPDITLNIPRYNKIKVLYYDLEGHRKKIKASGLFARVLQHEIDHLNGILITDRHSELTEQEKVVNEQ